MKILVVLTGGTISTVEQDGVMGICGNSPYDLLEKYEKIQEEKNKTTEFTVIEPVRMLSECNRPYYLEKIYYGILEALGLGSSAEEIRDNFYEGWDGAEKTVKKELFPYDGIIVTHGSDTLSYTAAFLSVVFSWIPIPLVLTAADYPLSNPHSNGMKNFTDAVEFVRKQQLFGVFAVWQNKAGGANLYHASQLLEAGTGTDCFSSYLGEPFGEIQNGELKIFHGVENVRTEDDRKEETCKNDICQEDGKKDIFRADIHMEHDVLLLRPYPGLRYDLISLENTNIKAVVHYLYHSATACTEGEKQDNDKADYNILSFAKYCKNLGIDFYIAGFKSKDQALYETNDLLLKSGLAKPLYQMSPELAYMKVLIAYNQTLYLKEEVMEG